MYAGQVPGLSVGCVCVTGGCFLHKFVGQGSNKNVF